MIEQERLEIQNIIRSELSNVKQEILTDLFQWLAHTLGYTILPLHYCYKAEQGTEIPATITEAYRSVKELKT
ncbi:MAG: hypothetical protein JXA33_24965 [Anaerolineae bacterium]|nr:hypothetical protein [Anaerolineae bacterium]